MQTLRYISLKSALVAVCAISLGAQTHVDLRTQSKSVDFGGANMTRPVRTAATLPSTCVPNELILISSAPAGSNIYACLTQDNWVPQGGTPGSVTVQNSGTPIGARGTQNFIPGTGLLNVITDTGSRVTIQQTVDTAQILSKTTYQTGQSIYCNSVSNSPTTYTCAVNPSLTAYAPGMVLNWRPDLNGNGGATTLNVDLLGAVPVTRSDGSTSPATGEILAGQLYPVWFDGTVFRMLQGIASGGGGGSSAPSGPPVAITASGASGPTTVTGTAEWHAPLAFCTSATAAALAWNAPPTGQTAATADGCSGTGVNDAYAAFTTTGAPSLQTSFVLPRTLTGTADVYLTYLSPTAGGSFTPALDLTCTAVDGTVLNDGAFSGGNFFNPGVVLAPGTPNLLATVGATSLSWPSGCTAGSRAHLRLIRTDTAGSATKVDIAEVVLVMRRTL